MVIQKESFKKYVRSVGGRVPKKHTKSYKGGTEIMSEYILSNNIKIFLKRVDHI